MLSQHVKRLITRITMYPGGYIEKKSFVAGLREHLINAGKDAATVDNHITEKLNIEPNPAERFFTMISPSAAVRVIRPDMQNPEILQLDVPGDDVKNNMASHGNAFGAVFEKLAELASKSSSPDKIGSLS